MNKETQHKTRMRFPINSYLFSVIEQLHELTCSDVPFDESAFRTLSEEFIGHYNDNKVQVQ